MLVDSHCHLDRLKLEECGGSLDAAIEGAKIDGVEHLLCVCISEANRHRVLEIAHQYANVYSSMGVHPCDVSDNVVSVDQLLDWCSDQKVVALGETGLDYYYSRDKETLQKRSFANHLIAGAELGLPVIVHTRDAQTDTIELIRNYGSRDSSGVLHCFTESWDMARQALDLNYYISISGIVTFRNADELRDVVKKVPLDRLLIETDSPYLAPIPFRGKSNQPRYVKAVASFIAELLGMEFERVAEQTTKNFFDLFSKAKT